jgi:rhomboid family GlyGly-CTERM serine protease
MKGKITFLAVCALPSLILALGSGSGVLASLEGLLLYDREAILSGEIWRMWTCHFVHFGLGHLWPNLAAATALVFALPKISARQVICFIGLLPPFISLGLLLFAPGLNSYAGFSGLASGLLTWWCAERIKTNSIDPVAWVALDLFIVKLVWELAGGSAWFGQFEQASYRVEPMAHLAGMVGFILVLSAARLQGKVETFRSEAAAVCG